jgi:hypothetical protein
MDDFGGRGLDEDAFGEKSGLSALKTFDAFREDFSHLLTANTDQEQRKLSLHIPHPPPEAGSSPLPS